MYLHALQILEMITAFPYADVGEDTIIQYMFVVRMHDVTCMCVCGCVTCVCCRSYIEKSPGGQVAFDDVLRVRDLTIQPPP